MVHSCKISQEGAMPLHMKLVKGRWYSNVRPKDNWKKVVCVSLDAYEHQTHRALIALGSVLTDIKNGIDPVSARKRVGSIKLKNLSERSEQIIRTHLKPFFGEYKPSEVDRQLIENYIEHRWGRVDGQLQAIGNTCKKELTVLQMMLRSVNKSYSLPEIKYKRLARKILPPLTLDQIKLAEKYLLEKYKPIYWVMAYTAMDISDVLALAPEHIVDGWIHKTRGKTGNEIAVPVCSQLSKILKSVPRPLKHTGLLFPNIHPKAVSKDVRKAFRQAGLDGYGAKYLRRFVASGLMDLGYSMDWIAKALAHSDGSALTKKYTKVYRGTLEQAFKRIGER